MNFNHLDLLTNNDGTTPGQKSRDFASLLFLPHTGWPPWANLLTSLRLNSIVCKKKKKKKGETMCYSSYGY